MIPQDDWMELKLWEKQADTLSVRLALPDTVDRVSDEGAMFQVVRMGPLVHEHKTVKVGDVVVMVGLGAVAKLKLPNGATTVVGRLSDVAFVMEAGDLRGS